MPRAGFTGDSYDAIDGHRWYRIINNAQLGQQRARTIMQCECGLCVTVDADYSDRYNPGRPLRLHRDCVRAGVSLAGGALAVQWCAVVEPALRRLCCEWRGPATMQRDTEAIARARRAGLRPLNAHIIPLLDDVPEPSAPAGPFEPAYDRALSAGMPFAVLATIARHERLIYWLPGPYHRRVQASEFRPFGTAY